MNQEEMLDNLANRMQQMQINARDTALKRGRSVPLRRAFHAKGLGLRARFKINSKKERAQKCRERSSICSLTNLV